MLRFDVYRNPNPRATHALYIDVQSDLDLCPRARRRAGLRVDLTGKKRAAIGRLLAYAPALQAAGIQPASGL